MNSFRGRGFAEEMSFMRGKEVRAVDLCYMRGCIHMAHTYFYWGR